MTDVHRVASFNKSNELRDERPGIEKVGRAIGKKDKMLESAGDKKHPYPLSRISRALSRCQSRFAELSRLSCSFLPLARPSRSFARPRAL